MDSLIIRTLKLLGFGDIEIKIFLASFRLGLSSIPEVAKEAKVKRSTAYLVIRELTDKGYMLEEFGKHANLVQTIAPEELLTKLSAKQRRLRRQEIELEENLDKLKSVYQISEVRPKIRSFKGNEGLISVWKDILSTRGEILLWTNQQTENQFFGTENHNKFIKERLAKKLKIRVLATDSQEARELQNSDASTLRQTKILPPKNNLSAEIYIYDNKIAMIDYNKDVIGLIIESLPISSSNREIFETMWEAIR